MEVRLGRLALRGEQTLASREAARGAVPDQPVTTATATARDVITRLVVVMR